MMMMTMISNQRNPVQPQRRRRRRNERHCSRRNHHSAALIMASSSSSSSLYLFLAIATTLVVFGFVVVVMTTTTAVVVGVEAFSTSPLSPHFTRTTITKGRNYDNTFCCLNAQQQQQPRGGEDFLKEDATATSTTTDLIINNNDNNDTTTTSEYYNDEDDDDDESFTTTTTKTTFFPQQPPPPAATTTAPTDDDDSTITITTTTTTSNSNSNSEDEDEDEFYRQFRNNFPKPFQSWIRDSGFGRYLADTLVLLAIPDLLKKQPHALGDFLKLTFGTSHILTKMFFLRYNNNINNSTTKLTGNGDITVTKLVYGTDDPKRQIVNLIQQQDLDDDDDDDSDKNNRIIVFVHGGAWGSGFPSMYSLVATPFLNAGYNKVAMVGYRTYPSTKTIQGQIDDIQHGLEEIIKFNGNAKITIIGHSSGAHVLALGFVRENNQFMSSLMMDNNNNNIDGFIGLAGVYDIYTHYKKEKQRGVNRISPMSRICGSTTSGFRFNSPTNYYHDANANANAVSTTTDNFLNDDKKQSNLLLFPTNTILLHGDEDTTVSYKLTQSMANSLRLPWELLEGVGHAEMVLELMFGGTTQDFILNWLLSLEEKEEGKKANKIK